MSKLENGKPEQNLEPLRHYAKILHLPQQKLWFDLPGQSRLDQTGPGRGHRTVAADRAQEDRGAPENIAVTAATIVDFNSLGCGGDRIEVDDLPQLRRQMTRLVELDNQFGGGDIAKTGVRLFKYLHHRLGTGSHDPTIRKDLVAITGEVAEITGWLAYDLRAIDILKAEVPHARVVLADGIELLASGAAPCDILLSNLPWPVTEKLIEILPGLAIRRAVLAVSPSTSLDSLADLFEVELLGTAEGADYTPPQPGRSNLVRLVSTTRD